MIRGLKRGLLGVCLVGMAALVWGCGDEEEVAAPSPAKYIDNARDAVEENNENVDQINQSSDAIENGVQE